MKLPLLTFGIGGGLLIALAIAPFTGTALGRLSKARAERDALAMTARTPWEREAILAPGLALGVGDAVAGRAAMLARVETLAKAGGVLVEESKAIEVAPGLAGLRIRVSGAEKAVVALADALERGRPLVRLRSWRIEPIAGGVRLTAEAIAAWR